MRDIGRIHAAVELCRAGWTDAALAGPWADPRTPLILQPLRWAWAIRPRWIACEQVPPAMPVWLHMADVLRSWGYSATAVRLMASDYGVPQTRLRAFLLASLDGPVRVPAPTHAKRPEAGLFGTLLPWVSMAAALGWDGAVWTNSDNNRDDRTYLVETDQPAPMMTERGTRWVLRQNNQANGAERTPDEPAPVLHFGGRLNWVGWTLQVGSQANATTRPAPAPAHDAAGVKWVLDRRAAPSADGVEPVSVDRPAPTMTFSHGREVWVFERPATTLVGAFSPDVVSPPGQRDFGPDGAHRQDAEGAVRITLAEAAVLQGFRPDYPFVGTKSSRFRQCGDAVCPPVAAAVVAALVGANVPELRARDEVRLAGWVA